MRVENKETNSENRLMALHEMKKFKVSKDEPDIRGWEVVTSDHKKIGKVHELIVDTLAMKVRYLVVDVEGSVLSTKSNSHVLIPIAGAQLDDADNRVYLDMDVAKIAALPPYDDRPISRDYETTIARLFGSSDETASPADDRDFYDQKQYADKAFWGKRRAGREDKAYIAPADERTPADREDNIKR